MIAPSEARPAPGPAWGAAGPAAASIAGDGPGAVLVFELAGERFAVPAASVEEVVEEATLAPLPAMPGHVAGLLRHRGRLLPAIDAATLLDVGANATGGAALILRRGAIRYALVADTVLGMRPVPSARAGSADAAAGPLAGDAAAHAASELLLLDDGTVVSLLDPERLFAADAPGEVEEESMGNETEYAAPIPVVAFRLGADEFALAVSQVHEVLPYREPRTVPRLPDFVEGIVEFRGSVLPVIDLRARLQLPRIEPDAETRILVVDLADDRVGLIVDAVTEVVRLPAADVAEPPALFRGLDAQFLDGLGRVHDRILILLRIDRVLTSDQRLALLGAETGGAGSEDGGPDPEPKPRRRTRKRAPPATE